MGFEMFAVPDRSRWVVALVLCLLVPAAGVASATAVPEGEPNDTPWDATVIESGVAVNGTVDDLYNPYTGWYDQDYFLIYATDGTEIAAGLSRSGGSRTLYVAIGTLDNVPLTEFVAVGTDASETVRTTAPETGWYLVYVTGYLGHESVPGAGSYVLTVHAGADVGTPATPDLPDPTEASAPPPVPDGTGPSTAAPPTETSAPAPTPTEAGASVPGPGGTPGPGGAGLLAASLVGFLLGLLTGNAENEGTKKQLVGVFVVLFTGSGVYSLVEGSPGLWWLAVAGVVGVVVGLLVGTVVRNAGLTYAPR